MSWASGPVKQSAQTARAQPAFSFTGPFTYPVGLEPMEACAADFDLDGYLDIALANMADGTFSVLFNEGNGRFEPQVKFASGVGPMSIISLNLNSDKWPDLAVANFGSKNVTLFVNDGHRAFSKVRTLYGGDAPWHLAWADLNSDSLPEIVVLDADNFTKDDTGQILIYAPDSDSGYELMQQIRVGAYPYYFQLLDWNGDGDLDLWVMNFHSQDALLLENKHGKFRTKEVIPFDTRCVSMFCGKLNPDQPDILAITSLDSLLVVYDQDLNLVETHHLGFAPFYVTAADLNNDSDQDLILASLYQNKLALWENTGLGFRPGLTVGTERMPYWIVPTDLDHDGDIDLVVTNHNSNSVSVWLNQHFSSILHKN